MSISTFVKIIDKLKGAISLELSGGEPFLNKDIFDMIKYAHSKKMHVSVSTNGTILYNKIDQIIYSWLSTLNISLDAVDSSDYKSMHGAPKSVFYTVLENITALAEKKKRLNHHLKLKISHVCTKRNYKRIPDMVRLAEELDVDELLFHNLIPFGLPGFSKDQSLYDDDSEVVEVIESVEQPSSKLRVVMPRLHRRVISERLCRMPFTTMPMNGDGYVSTCCQITPQREYGNILHNENVWNNFHYQGMRKILIDNSELLPDICKTCPLMSRPYKILLGKDL
jgi:MoaA/NifB/PqqE/SkfB family radical SAM enzyme